jgi:hypothetical protein
MEPNFWETQEENILNPFDQQRTLSNVNPQILLDRLLKMESRQRELESVLSRKVKEKRKLIKR